MEIAENHKLVFKMKNLKKQYRILIVDDDKNIAELLKDVMILRGHNVTIITDSIGCLNKCQNINYDIIFMDFHMEQLDGIELTSIIKNACNNNSLIFAFTGDNSNNAIKQFKNIGMNGAIIKPIDINIISKFMNIIELQKSSKSINSLNSSFDSQIIKINNKQFNQQIFYF